MARACGSKLPRTLKMIDLMEKQHRVHAEPHYYLAFVGTDPDRQGQGHGTVLLETVLQRCDVEGAGAYLEASSVRNQALYHRHRFEVVEEHHWPGGGPPFWRMWRDPVPLRCRDHARAPPTTVGDRREFLDVDVDQLARTFPLVTPDLRTVGCPVTSV